MIKLSIYDIKVEDMKKNEVPLSNYKGKVLLIVNTATSCGLTPQYTGLQKLYSEYKDSGLEILDFPCNQFASQAKGSDEEIHTFCTGRFGITFPQFSKIDVNGVNESSLYTLLKSEKGSFLGSKIKWNFTKFLVDQNGNVVKRYAPTVKPEKLEKDVAELIGAAK